MVASPCLLTHGDVLRRKAALAIAGSIYGRFIVQLESGTRDRLPGATPRQIESAIVKACKHLTVAIERDLLREYRPGVDCELTVPKDVLDRLITEAIGAAVAEIQGVLSC